jgi:hypothetical protein
VVAAVAVITLPVLELLVVVMAVKALLPDNQIHREHLLQQTRVQVVVALV